MKLITASCTRMRNWKQPKWEGDISYGIIYAAEYYVAVKNSQAALSE